MKGQLCIYQMRKGKMMYSYYTRGVTRRIKRIFESKNIGLQ